jgi:ribosomal protein L37AE/L43A
MKDIKKFGVVICPKCHRPRGVRLKDNKSKCYHCGYTFTISKLKLFHETDSESNLAEAVGRLNAKLQGGLDEYLSFLEEYENVPVGYEGLEPHKRIAAKLRYVNDQQERLEKLAQELSLELDEFEDNDIIKVLKELGLDDIQSKRSLSALLENNIIYEPQPGKYKLVGIAKK